MDSQKQSVAQTVKEANNVLVTVSANPSVDQLAACIGLTLALNKMGKHATAVYSGKTPSTISFLQPEKTLEKNTDSLRDFIISLDKAKADKLRYKVEDKVVKIFITPYKTSIGEHDLEFSQGDFNVDVVVAIGVHSQADLDQAITAHGRILHDANIVTINSKPGGQLGGINWLQDGVSSLSELASQLVFELDKTLVDAQIATALLTGIVAETERFSNELTSPQTMSVAAELMAAGANQQLVATKLQAPPPPPPKAPEPEPIPEAPEKPKKKTDDGTLEIAHDKQREADEAAKAVAALPPVPPPQPPDDTKSDSDAIYDAQPAPTSITENLIPEAPAATPEQGPLPEPEAPELPPKQPEHTSQPEIPAEPMDTDDEHTPEEKAILNQPKIKGVHKNSRPYLGSASHRAEDDSMLLGMPDVAPEPTAIMPDMLTAPKDSLSLPDLDMPLLERQPLSHADAKNNPVAVKPEPAEPAADKPQPTPKPTGTPEPAKPSKAPVPAAKPEKPAEPEAPDDPGGTLADLEKEVHSPHLSGLSDYEALDSDPMAGSIPALSLPELPGGPVAHPVPAAPAPLPPAPPQQIPVPAIVPHEDVKISEDGTLDLGSARDAVAQAISSTPAKEQPQAPIEALNAQPLGGNPLHGPTGGPNEGSQIKGSTGIVIVPPEGEAHDDNGAPPPIPPPFMPGGPGAGK